MDNSRQGQRILVVDDDVPLREAVARYLRRCGYYVVTAEDAEVALAQTELGRPPFDVVVTDVHMPGMNGIELATVLLDRRPTQRVVIVTGDPNEALARDALSRGPVNYLLKPFELFELQAAVSQALATPRYAPPMNSDLNRAGAQVTIGTVPAEWLLWVDDRSYAGVGHGDRVARVARVLAMTLKPPFMGPALAELEVAAWSHDIGFLAGPSANPVEMAWRSAELLRECNSSDNVVRTVRYMHERWDGLGGPEGLSRSGVPGSSQVLAVADSIDHYCGAWMKTGIDPQEAAQRAISLVASQQGTYFNPDVTAALLRARDAICSIVGVVRREPALITAEQPERSFPVDAGRHQIDAGKHQIAHIVY